MMRLSEGGAIIGAEDVEPIVPVGGLVDNLGWTLQWTEGHMVLYQIDSITLSKGRSILCSKKAVQ